MQITYRTATTADLPILLQFEQEIITAERPFDPHLKPDPISYYDVGAMIEQSDVEVIVAVAQSTIVGSCYVKIVAAKPYVQFAAYAYLGFMFVEKEFRGRGISQGIITEARNWARSRGLSELRLEVYSDNARAIRAYEKAGFEQRMTEMRMGV